MSSFIDDFSRRVGALMDKTPVRDIEKNARTMLQGALARMDLVTREEFDVQSQVLIRTREKLALLEARVAELERAAAAMSTDKPSAE